MPTDYERKYPFPASACPSCFFRIVRCSFNIWHASFVSWFLVNSLTSVKSKFYVFKSILFYCNLLLSIQFYFSTIFHSYSLFAFLYFHPTQLSCRYWQWIKTSVRWNVFIRITVSTIISFFTYHNNSYFLGYSSLSHSLFKKYHHSLFK